MTEIKEEQGSADKESPSENRTTSHENTEEDSIPEVPTAAPSTEKVGAEERPMLTVLATILLQLFAIGLGFGLFVALLSFPELKTFSATNALDPKLRSTGLLYMGGCILLCLLVGLGPLLYRRSFAKVRRHEPIVSAFLPLCWLWPLPLYADPTVFNGTGLPRVIIALIWALGLERAFRPTFRLLAPLLQKPFSRLPKRFNAIASWTILGSLIITFAVYCSHYTVLQHERMMTSAFDLGIFDNLIYNLMEGEWFRGGVDRDNRGGAHLQFHANFLAYLFVPFYALSPRAETLLILQSWLVALSAVPFFLLAKHRLKSYGAALIFAFVYLGHEALQGPIFYDFHFLTVAPFFIGWTLFFFDRGGKWTLLIAWLCTALLREDQGAILGAAALVYLLMGHRPTVAIIGGILGVVWLGLMRFWIMPLHAADGSFQQHIGIFQAMVAPGDHGFGGVIKTMVTNPVFTLNNVLEERKLEYVLLLVVPFVLLPFRSPRLLLLFIPPALFTLGTANYPPPVSKGFQYTMYWMPLLMLGGILQLSRWQKQQASRERIPAALATMLVVSAAISYGSGVFFQHGTFTGGFRRVEFKMHDAERERLKELRQLIADIPPNATITGSESIVPHFSNRSDAHTIRQGLGDPEYIVLRNNDVRRGRQADNLIAGLGPFPQQRYGVIVQSPLFQVWKRGAPKDKNMAALRALGHRPKPPPRPKRSPKRRRPVQRPTPPKAQAPSPKASVVQKPIVRKGAPPKPPAQAPAAPAPGKPPTQEKTP